MRIDKYLKKLLCNAPSNFIYKMFRKKDIKINGKKVNEKYILQKDDILEMFLYDDKFNEFTNDKVAKPASEVKVGDIVCISNPNGQKLTIEVKILKESCPLNKVNELYDIK